MSTLFDAFSSQSEQLSANSGPIGPYLRGALPARWVPHIPGNEICVAGSYKQSVEASIFWLGRHGVQFELYLADSAFPASQNPMAGLFLFFKFLGLRIEELGNT